MSELAYVVVLKAQPGKIDELREALAEIVRCTRQEPGSTIIEWHAADGVDGTWMLYERWRDQAAFDSHMQQPHTVKFVARMGELLGEPADVRTFRHLG